MLVKKDADIWLKGEDFALHGDLYTVHSWGWMIVSTSHNHDIKPEDCELTVNDVKMQAWNDERPQVGDVIRRIALDDGGEIALFHKNDEWTTINDWFEEFLHDNAVKLP